MNRKRSGRILIVDDDEKWRETLVKRLQQEDFFVDSASRVDEVLERLAKEFYHLLILDIRLVDSDPNNTEGIDLLRELDKQGLSKVTTVVILSGYGTLEHARRAFRDYEVADFLEKDKIGPQVLLESVKQIFTQNVRINLALGLEWQGESKIEQIVRNLAINGKLVGRNTILRKHLAEELDDLFCRLFHEAGTVLVYPLTAGRSGAGVVLVQLHGEGGREEDVIVKFGERDKIEKEHANFQQHVRRYLTGSRSTIILDQRYTPHLGGIVYSLVGAGKDQFVDFSDFYHNTSDISKIVNLLGHLFQDTCTNWYINRLPVQPRDLAAEYQQLFDCSPRKLERILASELRSARVEETLTFPSLNTTRRFPNPLSATAWRPFIRFTSTCRTHGDFNPHNLLVNQSGFAWLIDFQSTEWGHILRDFAMLDSAIRFQLLTGEEATLEERLQMEDLLCKAKQFDQMKQLETELATNNQALAKAYATVIYLRSLAGRIGAQDPRGDMSEYHIALFYNALNTLQFSSLETIQREHALLCASLLVDRLGLGHS